jgi:CelD/BcsL family acetyltransferase involved in cellulose biosynthesis
VARVLTTLEELDAEADRWGPLDEAAVSPSQRFAWIRACAASFGEELGFVIVEHDGELAAVAPLIAKSGSLELVGARDLYEPADFAYLDEDALGSLARELRRRKSSLVIPRIPVTSPTVSALRRAFRGRGGIFMRAAGATPVVLLGQGDPVERFSPRRRADLRRALRRAEQIGEVVTEVTSPRSDEAEAVLNEFFEVEAAGWKGERGTALVDDPDRRRFFDEYTRAAAEEGRLRGSVLRIGDQTAAVQLAVEHARRLWLLKIGYDERFARCSPGTLLLLETVRWAGAAGLEAVELLGHREPWTRFWTEEERTCVAMYAYPATLRGVASLASDAAGHSRRRVTRGVVERSGRAHVAGEDLDAALSVSRELARKGVAVALGYWDAPGESSARVEAMSLAAVEGIAEAGLDGYVALKPASLTRIDPILDRARELGVPVHLDSTGLEEAQASWDLLAEIAGPDVGCTLPTRWGRSLADARRAVELGLRVRVVKGQWPDPDYVARAERKRFLEIVDAVAGARHVAVGTHDRPLAKAALTRVPHGVHERMLGLPWRGRHLGPTRIYVPFGHPYLPYAAGRARSSPRVALWVARDVIRGGR